MNNNLPLVSICVPTYNSDKYIRTFIDSITCQTYKNIEVIFSDNASTDDTVSIIREYCDKNGYILKQNINNEGACANFNKLIKLARGEFVAIYHSDDVYEPSIVEESVNMLCSDSEIGLVGTMGRVIDENGDFVRNIVFNEQARRMNLQNKKLNFDEAILSAIHNSFVTPSIMVRKIVYDNVGLFDGDKYKSSIDYEMWLRIAKSFKIAVIDKKLINYRIHASQGSELEIRKNTDIPDIVPVLKEYQNYITDYAVKRYCSNIIEKWILKTAKKQNYIGLYEKSNQTIEFNPINIYILPKLFFVLLNKLHISYKKRTL